MKGIRLSILVGALGLLVSADVLALEASAPETTGAESRCGTMTDPAQEIKEPFDIDGVQNAMVSLAQSSCKEHPDHCDLTPVRRWRGNLTEERKRYQAFDQFGMPVDRDDSSSRMSLDSESWSSR